MQLTIYLILLFGVTWIQAKSVEDIQVFRGTLSKPEVSEEPIAETNRNGRIFNGQTAKLGQFPWVVQMNFRTQNGGHFCSGSLVSSNFVVAARHCIAE